MHYLLTCLLLYYYYNRQTYTTDRKIKKYLLSVIMEIDCNRTFHLLEINVSFKTFIIKPEVFRFDYHSRYRKISKEENKLLTDFFYC